MYLTATKSIRCLFFFLTLAFIPILLSCGTDENADDGKDSEAGSYTAELIFPPDTPMFESDGEPTDEIDCEAAGIEKISCEIYSSDEVLIANATWRCTRGEWTVRGIPPGSGITAFIAAKDISDIALYSGEKSDITIEAGRQTRGEEIEMKRTDPETTPTEETDQDGDGYSPPEDCDDEDPGVHPDAVETPGNGIDDNCDGLPLPQSQGDAFTIDELAMEFVRIPAGTYIMGSPSGELGEQVYEAQHRVTLTRDYYMQTTEVTQAQWRIVASEFGDAVLESIAAPSLFRNCGDDCPVESISWMDIQRFIAVLNERYAGVYEFRLPTEAEWEYASRAGGRTTFGNGDITTDDCEQRDPILDSMGWYCYNSGSSPHPVAHPSKDPNAWGLYDMHGNVMEWCSDWSGGYPSGPVEDPEGPDEGTSFGFRVVRGGGWSSPPPLCRSAARGYGPPSARNELIGFRTVCIPVPR